MYPEALRRAKLKGVVVAEAVITSGGNLEDIKIVSSPAPELSSLALVAFRERRYKPAICRETGQPVQVTVTLTTSFTLQGSARR
jgi:TonB family protein